jgi:hypothetical protein
MVRDGALLESTIHVSGRQYDVQIMLTSSLRLSFLWRCNLRRFAPRFCSFLRHISFERLVFLSLGAEIGENLAVASYNELKPHSL